MNRWIEIPCGLALVAALPGCGKGGSVTTIAQAVTDQPNCLTSQDRLWSTLYRELDERGSLPDGAAVESSVRSLVRDGDQADALAAAYSTISREVRFLGRDEAMVRLAEMEIGDRTTEEKSARQDEVEGRLSRALGASVAALGACPTPAPPVVAPGADAVPMFEAWRTSVAAPLYGAYKEFSVGYQSCNAVSVTPLTLSTAAVDGIAVTGNHPSGTGLAREVTDAEAVFRTNPYYAGRRSPAGGCFKATATPLIYDYGGKPYASSAVGSAIDLFKNAGTGTDALGIDCSGFVTTAVLAAGLRLKQNVSNKAPQSGGVNAAMYTNPSANGLTCFVRLTSTKTEEIRSGDVIASTGHVVMVDKVRDDPFGIATAKTAADCDKASVSKFKFTIIQSSPSKDGIGMNRYLAADYFSGTSGMKAGMTAYARSFCRVRLGLDAPTTLANSSQAVIVRHQGGAACTDARIPLAGESCLAGCGTITASSL